MMMYGLFGDNHWKRMSRIGTNIFRNRSSGGFRSGCRQLETSASVPTPIRVSLQQWRRHGWLWHDKWWMTSDYHIILALLHDYFNLFQAYVVLLPTSDHHFLTSEFWWIIETWFLCLMTSFLCSSTVHRQPCLMQNQAKWGQNTKDWRGPNVNILKWVLRSKKRQMLVNGCEWL